MEVAVGGPVVGEAPLVDVLEGVLVADGEGPPGEASSWALCVGWVVLAVMSVSFLIGWLIGRERCSY